MVPAYHQILNSEDSWIPPLPSKHLIPFLTKSITIILSVFHVFSLTFTAYPFPLNSGLHHFLPRLWLHACHLQFMIYTVNREISLLSKSYHVISWTPVPTKIPQWFPNVFRVMLNVLTSYLSFTFVICHPTLNYICGELWYLQCSEHLIFLSSRYVYVL